MIANPGNPYPEVPHPLTLNDLRVHNVFEEAPEPLSPLALSGMAAVVVLAIGAFVWLDPLHLFTSTDATPPAPAPVASAPAQPSERQDVVAPPTPAPPTKIVEAPVSPPPPVAQAPQVQASAARPRVAATKPEPRGTPTDKIRTAARQASPEEKMAPPVVVTPEEKSAPSASQAKPEEKADVPTVAPMVAPSIPKPIEDTKSAPPAPAASNPPPATE